MFIAIAETSEDIYHTTNFPGCKTIKENLTTFTRTE